MSGRCRLSCQSVEVRVSEVLEDQLYVDVVLGAGGEHLQLQLGGQVLRLVPGEEDHEVVRGAWCPVPRSSYCLSIMSDSLHQTTPDCFSISGGLGRTWASLGQSGTLRQHPVNTRTPTPSTPHSTSCVPSHNTIKQYTTPYHHYNITIKTSNITPHLHNNPLKYYPCHMR